MDQETEQTARAVSAGRRRRRAVGPPGATPASAEPRAEHSDTGRLPDDDERLLRERPPHHDKGV